MVRTAVTPAVGTGSLAGALADFGVDPGAASDFSRAVHQGGLLVFIRTQDEHAAEVNQVLEQTSGRQVQTYNW